jgi:hypothetical protein
VVPDQTPLALMFVRGGPAAGFPLSAQDVREHPAAKWQDLGG